MQFKFNLKVERNKLISKMYIIKVKLILKQNILFKNIKSKLKSNNL